MILTTIEAVDIQDAWFQCISKILDVGFKYEIQHGSYVGQTRLEFDHITVGIKKPYSEPYDSMLPQIPQSLNIPNPVTNGYVEQYLPYLLTDHIETGEQYTYGSRIYDQIQHFVEVFKSTPNTNQAILQVAQPSDNKLSDPPCLRHIDMRVKEVIDTEKLSKEVMFRSFCSYTLKDCISIDGARKVIKSLGSDESEYISKQLIFYPYFRSWDLWGGFPANLAGIAVLQKMMADEIDIKSGPIIASSKGLHLYGYVEELAKIRVNK